MSISLLDLAVIWLTPVVVLAALWQLSAFVVYVIAVSPGASPLKEDLRCKYDAKRKLRSGSRLRRLSYLWVARLLLADNCVQATVLYRMSAFFLRHRLRLPAYGLHAFSKFLTNLDISPHARIGPGVYFYHGLGAVIGKGTTIGSHAVICQQVTTGGGPTIGDDVRLWAGAKVIGKLTIGDRVEVGANAVVIGDVPSDCVVVGVPATRVIEKRSEASEVQEVANR